MSARRIGGNGFSSWLTATSTDAKSSGASGYSTESGRHAGTTLTDAMREWPTPLAGRKGPGGEGLREGGPTLQTSAQEWATPNAHERAQRPREVDHGIQLANQVDRWSTPNARDWKGEDIPGPGRNGSPSLPAQVMWRVGNDGSLRGARPRLNPDFVEALMGLPPGWTACDASEMGPSRLRPPSPSPCCASA